MFERLHDVQRRYEEVANRLADPSTAADPADFSKLSKELAALEPLVTVWQSYQDLETEIRELDETLSVSDDPAFNELLEQERSEKQLQLDRTAQDIRFLLLPKDENDEKSVVLEIRAGAGGEEAALFAHSLWRMYSMYAVKLGWRCETVSVTETELGGVKELIASVEGKSVYNRLKFESGVHRVQRVPQTETQGRIHTSTATVAVMPEVEVQEIDLNPNDLRIDTFRSSGAGGQHINKTSSAIRVTHLPTGMVVECQDQRSQRENKSRALQVLASRLLQKKQEAYDEAYNAQRQNQVGSADRSEKIRTYNFPQDRVTDHRIGLTLHDLQSVLDGNLDRLIDPLLLADREEKLRARDGEWEKET